MKHKVYADLPQTGLGNLLLVWARARVFSELNGLPLITSSWWRIRWGAWLRAERRKRLYWGYFKESSCWQRLQMRVQTPGTQQVTEPAVAPLALPAKKTVYRFADPAVNADLFGAIRPYRDTVKAAISNLLLPALAEQLSGLTAPEIAVHIRRGDFRYGNPVTPTTFFIQCIELVRAQAGRPVPVMVFTDAARGEIADLLALENIHLATSKPDILDLLQMSRSQVLVLSQSSTFSYWAAFLSEAIVIKPWGDWQNDLRPQEVNRTRYEGKISFDKPETLVPLRRALQNEKW